MRLHAAFSREADGKYLYIEDITLRNEERRPQIWTNCNARLTSATVLRLLAPGSGRLWGTQGCVHGFSVIHDLGVGQESGQISRIVTTSLIVMHVLIVCSRRIVMVNSSVTIRLSMLLVGLRPVQIAIDWLPSILYKPCLKHFVALTQLAAQEAVMLLLVSFTVARSLIRGRLLTN